MKDPWRIVDPIRQPPTADRIDPGDDFDMDLRPSVSCVLRFRACAIEVLSPEIESPRDALEQLAKCILALKAIRGAPEAFGIKIGARHRHALATQPPAADTAARLECEDVMVWFRNVSLDRGALDLTRALIRAARDPKLAPILRKHGVTPMLRSA